MSQSVAFPFFFKSFFLSKWYWGFRLAQKEGDAVGIAVTIS
jgi:hypothetical protein